MLITSATSSTYFTLKNKFLSSFFLLNIFFDVINNLYKLACINLPKWQIQNKILSMFDHCVMTDQVIHSLKLSKLLMQLPVAQPMLFWSAIDLFASLARIAQDGVGCILA